MRKTVWLEESTRTKTVAVRWYNPDTGAKDRHLCRDAAEAKVFKANKILWLENWRPGQVATDKDPLTLLAEHLAWGVNKLDKPWREKTIKGRKEHVSVFLSRPSVRGAADFTAAEVEAWAAEMRARGNSQGTLHCRLKELRGFFNWCREAGYVPNAPKIEVPKCPEAGRRLTLKEINGIIEHSPEWLRAFLCLKANTGCRKSDLMRAEWQDIDTHRWAWNIPAHKEKTGNSRTIPLGKPEQAALLSILDGKHPADAVGLIFMIQTPLRGRRPLDLTSIARGWKQAKIRAGVTGKARLHDLRHSYASWFRGRWDSLKKICGWKTDAMASRYTHTLYEELKEDKERFGVNLGYIGGKSDNNGQ